MKTITTKFRVITTSAIVFGIFALTIYVNASGFTDGAKTVNINTTVNENMALVCGATATIPAVTPGTPQATQSTCSATTNGALGFNLKAMKTTASSDATKTLVNGTTWILDSSLTPYNNLPADPIVWVNGTTKGLGFRVNVTGTNQTNTITDWAADASPKYAAFPTTNKTIFNYGSYSAAATTVAIDYKLDVPGTQLAGAYTGSVTYTATTN